MKSITKMFLGVLAATLLAGPLHAQTGELNVYSALDEAQADSLIKAFNERYPDVKVNAIIASTGPTVARVIAEGENPRGDIVMGAAVSALMAADKRGLLDSYKPAHYAEVSATMKDQRPNPVWTGIDAWAGAVCFNTAEAARLKLPKPARWSDLTNPAYEGHITMPSPLSSGTAFLAINGWLTAFGEQDAWSFMDKLHRNISNYGHSGSAPCRQVAAGEAVIGISYSIPGVKAINDGAPVEIILPEEGLGWEIEGVSIIRGAKNIANAKLMADFMSSRDAAMVSAKFLPMTAYDDIQSLPKNYPADERSRLLKMDFDKLASSRDAVIAEWQKRYGTKVKQK